MVCGEGLFELELSQKGPDRGEVFLIFLHLNFWVGYWFGREVASEDVY